jgi:hypothetical protein
MKRPTALQVGVGLSVAYVTAVIAFAAWVNGGAAEQDRMALNEWGDYFTGFLSPLALAWFVITAFFQRAELGLQRHELKLQREEMGLQRREMERARDVWSDQQKEQKRTADAYLEANKIARETAFSSNVPYLMRKLEMLALRLCESASIRPEDYNSDHFDALSALEHDGPHRVNVWQSLRQIEATERFADDVLKLGVSAEAQEFKRFYETVREKAAEASCEYLVIAQALAAYSAVMKCAEASLWIGQERGIPLEMKKLD